MPFYNTVKSNILFPLFYFCSLSQFISIIFILFFISHFIIVIGKISKNFFNQNSMMKKWWYTLKCDFYGYWFLAGLKPMARSLPLPPLFLSQKKKKKRIQIFLHFFPFAFICIPLTSNTQLINTVVAGLMEINTEELFFFFSKIYRQKRKKKIREGKKLWSQRGWVRRMQSTWLCREELSTKKKKDGGVRGAWKKKGARERARGSEGEREGWVGR